jgi:hypothetical protein
VSGKIIVGIKYATKNIPNDRCAGILYRLGHIKYVPRDNTTNDNNIIMYI